MSAKLAPGSKVQILAAKGEVAELFIGQTGTVIGKCGIYSGAVVVKVDGYAASYYPKELKVINSSPAKER